MQVITDHGFTLRENLNQENVFTWQKFDQPKSTLH
jgi:hypothetical protein